MSKKFVISRNQLIIGNVQFHMDLVSRDMRNTVVGGGYWHRDIEKNMMYFYGTSTDFGSVTFEQFDAASKQLSIETHKLYFSQKDLLSDVLEEEKLENL